MFRLGVIPASSQRFYKVDALLKAEITPETILGHREISAQDDHGNRLLLAENSFDRKYAVRRRRQDFEVLEVEAHGVKLTGAQVLEMLENLLDCCARQDQGSA